MKLFCQAPAPDLRFMVRLFWMLEVPPSFARQKISVIADTAPELMFQIEGVSTSSFSQTDQEYQFRHCMMGGYQGHAQLEFQGAVRLIFVKLQPWALRTYFQLSPADLLNLQVDFGEIGQLELRNTSELLAQGSYHKWKRQIESFLRRKMRDRTPDRNLMAAVRLIEQSKGQIAVHALTDRIPLGERRLEQLFKDEIGISPKRYAKTMRIRSACKAMERGNFRSLTHLAYQFGFSDQAHFIRDFRTYMQMSPRAYLSQIETEAGIKLVLPNISDSFNFPDC